MQHRAHYLQNRDKPSYKIPDRPSMLYTSTCDCGWVSPSYQEPRLPMLAYSRHVNYIPDIPAPCSPPDHIIVDGVQYRKDN